MADIWSEVRFAHITIKNSIARSATNDYMGHPDGTVSAGQKAIYRDLAAGGVGLVFTGHYAVDPLGRNDINQNGLWDDRFLAGQQEIASIAHAQNVKIIAQLNHAGAKAQDAAIGRQQPVAPSAVKLAPGNPARALHSEEIAWIQTAFQSAALRAKGAGFDGVQLHCAHGYLFSQFLDPSINCREDAYGGSVENRFRIVEETLIQVKCAVGAAFPVFLKINCNAPADGITEQDFQWMLSRARECGAEAVEVSGFDFNARKPDERLYYMQRAAAARQASGLPVILVGGVRTLEDMECARKSGIDMVSLARPLICQPDLPLRLLAGETARCVGCNGCFTAYQKSGKRCVLHT